MKAESVSGKPATEQFSTLEFPPELPVVQRREEIARTIAAHQVVIIAGETGSGKTTQLPKICLQLGRASEAMIGHTQPRRLAARTVAQRIAEEMGSELGGLVGYQVRFTEQVSPDTRVKLMTDGILLAEIQRDRDLRKYDTLIIDEAHERSLNVDFLLGYLKRLLPRRPDLKLIITSATIDVESFSRHFDAAPVVEVSGRTYPVETHYLEAEREDTDLNGRILAAVKEIRSGVYGAVGDILVFLSGERDIRELAQRLRQRGLSGLEVLPLYARLSHAEQRRVFQPGKRRGQRIVLATNVAETSLTVPGIRYVIDPGYARISRYSYRTQVQRLPIEAISQASANQRRGRCGRLSRGVCLRLYSEQDFDARPEFTEPEIRRTNLASVVLQMLRLKLGPVDEFPFLNPPDSRLVRDGYKLLLELGAVSAQNRLTDVGRRMSDFPVDPRFARMLLAAASANCLREILIVTSGMSVQDPRERPADKQQAADEKHRRFWHEKSDFLAWVSLWDYYEEQRQTLSQNQLRKLCQREYLAYMRMREWRDIHFQLTLVCRQAGLQQNRVAADYESLHRVLLSGLLGNMAQWDQGFEYRAGRNRKLQIFPGSSQFRKKPKWLLAGEIVETNKVYARMVAAVDPRWALDINPDLLKHHYYEPHWQARQGRVMALQRISLYGLVLVDKQRVHYGPVNPAEAREILIRAALVEGRVRQAPAFLRHNLALVEELEQLESRLRRRDIVVDEQVQVAFYDERLPDNITTLGRLKNWLKRHPGADQSLRMTRQLLSLRAPDEAMGEQFPDSLVWQDLELPLSYHFEPGHPADGVSVTLPVGLLNRVPRYLFQWLVPGLLREKCIALVKGLPKSVRKHLVPVPDHVDRALLEMSALDRPLTDVLGERLQQMSTLKISAELWQQQSLDTYYCMNFRIVDAQGSLLRQGRDLPQLVAACRLQTRAELQSERVDSPATRGLTRWSITEVPASWRQRQAGVEIESYPALVDEGDSVAVRLLDYPGQAEIAHRAGVIKLLRLQCAEQVRYLRKQMLRGNDASLVLAAAGMQRDALVEDLVDASFARALLADGLLPRHRDAFAAALKQGRGQLVSCADEYQTVLLNTLTPLAEVRQRLAQLTDAFSEHLRADVEAQLTALFGNGFLRDTAFEWVRHYPRYCCGILQRLQRFSGQQQKDRRHSDTLQAQWAPLRAMLDRAPATLLLSPPLARYRWMLEEFRVSLYAQNLGTSLPVSVKRLQQQWQKVLEWELENPL